MQAVRTAGSALTLVGRFDAARTRDTVLQSLAAPSAPAAAADAEAKTWEAARSALARSAVFDLCEDALVEQRAARVLLARPAITRHSGLHTDHLVSHGIDPVDVAATVARVVNNAGVTLAVPWPAGHWGVPPGAVALPVWWAADSTALLQRVDAEADKAMDMCFRDCHRCACGKQ
jgi:hypothetical protein